MPSFPPSHPLSHCFDRLMDLFDRFGYGRGLLAVCLILVFVIIAFVLSLGILRALVS